MGINAKLTPWLAATPMRLRHKMDEGMFRLAARIVRDDTIPGLDLMALGAQARDAVARLLAA